MYAPTIKCIKAIAVERTQSAMDLNSSDELLAQCASQFELKNQSESMETQKGLLVTLF